MDKTQNVDAVIVLWELLQFSASKSRKDLWKKSTEHFDVACTLIYIHFSKRPKQTKFVSEYTYVKGPLTNMELQGVNYNILSVSMV